MKYFLLSLTFLLPLYLLGQTPAITGKSFITFLDNTVVYGLGPDGKKDPSKVFKVPMYTKFNVNGFDDDNNVKITFWDYGSGPNKSTLTKNYSTDYPADKEYISSWANEKDFTMDLKVFNSSARLYYGERRDFTWGVMTLPIKARLGNGKDRFFEVEENLNLGFTAGVRFQIPSTKEEAINFLGGVSMSRVKVDSTSLNTPLLTPNSEVSTALSFSVGGLYQHESFQVGLFIGVDNVMNEIGRNWKYQGKPWIGFAIGVSLFTKNGSEKGTGTNE